MNNTTKFFDETFKVLLAMSVTTWILFLAFILFVGDSEGCAAGSPSRLLTAVAVAAGTLSALPLLYGLARLLFWPNIQKDKTVWLGGCFVGFGVAVFVAGCILFAMAVSQLGCG